MSHLEPDLSLEPNWNDLRVPITSTKLGGTKDPTFVKIADNGAGSQGVFAYSFSQTIEEEVYFVTQMPHGWVLGSNVNCHVHWSPTDTNSGNVVWGVELSITDAGGVLNPTTIFTSSPAAANGIAYANQLSDIAILDMSTHDLSSLILGRVFRDSTNVLDTYNAGAILMEIDFHYQQDTLGSNQEYAKG